MKRRPAHQKLTIRRETVRQLADLDLAGVRGGDLVLAFDSEPASCVTKLAVQPFSAAACGGR